MRELGKAALKRRLYSETGAGCSGMGRRKVAPGFHLTLKSGAFHWPHSLAFWLLAFFLWLLRPAACGPRIVNLILHTADISNSMKPFRASALHVRPRMFVAHRGGGISRIWAWQVLEEFFMQGDAEARLGVPLAQLPGLPHSRRSVFGCFFFCVPSFIALPGDSFWIISPNPQEVPWIISLAKLDIPRPVQALNDRNTVNRPFSQARAGYSRGFFSRFLASSSHWAGGLH